MSRDRIINRAFQFGLMLMLGAIVFTPSLVDAQAGEGWAVTEASGETARQTVAAQWATLKPGDIVAEGTLVRTGADGRLVLTRGNRQDTITAAPGSQFTVPSGVVEATDPSILQTLGTLLFKVEHTPGRRFEVKGPYLAVVVKGTVFAVTIGADENVVSLASGSVEVTDSNTKEVALLRPGQTARVPVAPGQPMRVIGALAPGAAPPSQMEAEVRDGGQRITRTLGDVQLNVAALSNNLVRPTGSAAGPPRTMNGDGAPSDNPAGAVPPMGNGGPGAPGGPTAGGMGGAPIPVHGSAPPGGSANNGPGPGPSAGGSTGGFAGGPPGNAMGSGGNSVGNGANAAPGPGGGAPGGPRGQPKPP
jgi:hypothetical protein